MPCPDPASPRSSPAPRVRASYLARERRAQHRERAAGGPADEATYACVCGEVFAAAVSTQVRCPACGSAQAW